MDPAITHRNTLRAAKGRDCRTHRHFLLIADEIAAENAKSVKNRLANAEAESTAAMPQHE